MADGGFKHDLIIATDDEIYHIPADKWQHEDNKVNPREYEYDPPDGPNWRVLRELLQCGANVAVVPPVLPPYPDGKPRPEPRGTCYVLNLAGFKRSNRFHVKA
jgi:hypothetical protein